MDHATPLINTLVAALALAFVAGLVAHRLRIAPIVGYLFAGIVVGPFTPGIVADVSLSAELAEIGVILLMFGVGLHFSVHDLMRVRAVAIPGAIVQSAIATAIGAALAVSWGWDLTSGIVFGLALSVASTVVLLRALEEHSLVQTERGRIAVAWLVVEDLVTVVALVLLPAFAEIRAGAADGGSLTVGGIAWTLGLTLGKVALFIAIALLVGRRAIPWLLRRVSHTSSRELFTLSVLAIALGIAFASAELFGVSLALGAFFAGVVLNESELSHKAGQDILPFRDAFAVLFFVAVGMLFDPMVLVEQPLCVLAVVLVIVFCKSLAALLVVLFCRHSLRTALTIAASLAQIGEFSFILMGVGLSLGLVSAEAQSLVLAGAILSIAFNPVAFRSLPVIEGALRRYPRLIALLDQSDRRIAEAARPTIPADWENHVIIVGHGRVGSVIAELLRERGIRYAVVETNHKIVNRLVAEGVPAASGDISDPAVSAAIGLGYAKLLAFAIPDSFQLRHALEYVRTVNPSLDIVARAHSEADMKQFESLGVGRVVMGERELALQMGAYALERMGESAAPDTAAANDAVS
ncbi:MAG TPA: YbaL family putative K(+) efflux transporter [Gammaproteobacteria bacterium]